MKHGKIELYTVILMSIGAGFIFLPRIGTSSIGRYLSSWAILGSGKIYGLNYSGLLLIAGFFVALLISFMMMVDLEKRIEVFIKEVKLRSKS